MSEEPKIEIEGKGFSLRIRGFKPFGQVTQYAADAIGVIGEPLGIVKDKLSAFRLNQREAAAIALYRAKQIKEERGEEIKPVSQKYLSNWLEGASNEDLASENLLEAWARLLANADSEFDAKFIAFNDALRKIGPKEASIFSSLLDPRYISGFRYDGKHTYRWCDVESCSKINSYIATTVRDVFEFSCVERITGGVSLDHKKPSLSKYSSAIDRLLNGFIVNWSVSTKTGGRGYVANEDTATILEHAGLITVSEINKDFSDKSSFSFSWATPTKIGLDLFIELNTDRLTVQANMMDAIAETIPDAKALAKRYVYRFGLAELK